MMLSTTKSPMLRVRLFTFILLLLRNRYLGITAFPFWHSALRNHTPA